MEDVDFEPPEMIWTKKIKNPCPWNYTKFYLNDSGTKRVCIKNDLTKFKVDEIERERASERDINVSKEIPLNPEIMKKLFHFTNVQIVDDGVVSYDAAMRYNSPRYKYLIYANFHNDKINPINSMKLIYGDENEFFLYPYDEDPFKYEEITLEEMDSILSKRYGRLFKSKRDLSRLNDKELIDQLLNPDLVLRYYNELNPDLRLHYDLIYEGQLINGKFDTTGSKEIGIAYNYDINTINYEGKWKRGLRHGKGKNTYKSGNVYEGQWKEGLRHGKGKIIYKNGAVYKGIWKDDQKDGVGFLFNDEKDEKKKKAKYTMLWVNGILQKDFLPPGPSMDIVGEFLQDEYAFRKSRKKSGKKSRKKSGKKSGTRIRI